MQPHAPTSVLHLAVEADLGAAVTLMIDHGADVEYRDRRAITPAELARQYNRWKAAEALGADDPSLPRRLDVRLGDGVGEHELFVSLTMTFPVGSEADPYRVDNALRSLERFAQAGVLGLHRFPPGTSSAQWGGPECELPGEPEPRDAPIGPCVVEGTYRVCDVAPEAVGLWLRAMIESTARIDAVTVHSDQADATVDRADLRRWFTGPPWSDLRPWPDLPFPVTEAAASGRACVVTADPAHHDSIEWTFSDLVNAVASELPMVPQVPWVEIGGRNGTYLLFTADDVDVLGRSRSLATAEVLRTVALSVLAGIAAETPGAITAVEWNVLTDGAPSAHRTEDFNIEDFTDPDQDAE